jgi:OmpA-OmpF porin, OOP family
MMIRTLGCASAIAMMLVPAMASAQAPSRAEYDCANFGECGDVKSDAGQEAAPSGARVSGSTRGMNISGRLGKKVTEAPSEAPASQRPVRTKANVTAAQKGMSAASGARPKLTSPAKRPMVSTAASTRLRLAQGITFMTGSADLTPAARANVDVLAESLLRPEKLSTRFRIEGHTDAVGEAAANKLLSERRAAAVHNHLVTKGVSASRLEMAGFGESALLQGVGPHAPANRRVETKLIN